MSSAHASAFACGDEDEPLASSMPPPPPRAPRRSTSGEVPPPVMRHGWQGGKPPPATLRQDIAARAAAAAAAENAPDYSDDEDYLRGDAVVKRQVEEERKRRRSEGACICDGVMRAGCPIHGSHGNSRSVLGALQLECDSEEDCSDDEEEWSAEMPAPLPQSVLAPKSHPAVAPVPSASPAPPGVPSNASELMGSAVREAFLSGIEQGKKMQLPTQCKTCVVRKERNRVAAKESRQKKRREAEVATFRNQVERAADYAASRAHTAPVPSPVAAPVATAAVVTSEIVGELEPPPF